MRALLIVNRKATTTSARARDVLAHALSSVCRLEVTETKARGHARELARSAAAGGMDVVVALGGDGTVNEVVNGLLSDGPGQGVPALGVVPAGSANVFARALGMPDSPFEATGGLLAALRGGRRRTIGLGRADGRWFTFCAGLGLDAAVIRRVEAQRARGRRATTALYVRTGVREFLRHGPRRGPALLLERDGHEPQALALALVCSSSPWTYLGERPVRPCPRASFDTGLDVFGLRRLALPTTLRHLGQIVAADPHPHGRHVLSLHDLPALTLTARTPLPFQLDGDDLGDRTRVVLTSTPSALSVVV